MRPPRRLAILFAVPQELAPLRRRLPGARRVAWSAQAPPGWLAKLPAGGEVLLCAGGVGMRRSGAAVAALLRDWPPDALLVAGVAGALSPSLRRGDVVVAARVRDEAESWAPPLLPRPDPPDRAPAHHVGTLLSRDRVLVTVAEKRAAAAAWPDALAVEMETAAAARLAAEHGLPWGAVRAVSDPADEPLPLDFEALRAPDGDLPPGRVALAALRRPDRVPALLHLARHTRHAAEALADFLLAWLESGPPVDAPSESGHTSP